MCKALLVFLYPFLSSYSLKPPFMAHAAASGAAAPALLTFSHGDAIMMLS
jgi:hypothetical protein